MRKEKRYGGAERAWDVRAELPISFIIVGRKTGRELNATLQQRSMPAVK